MAEFFELLILIGAIAILLMIVVVPIVLLLGLIALAVKLAVFLVLLPIRVLGWGVGLGIAAFGLVFKGLILTGAAALLLVFGLIPLLPLLVIGLLIYALTRSSRSARAPVA